MQSKPGVTIVAHGLGPHALQGLLQQHLIPTEAIECCRAVSTVVTNKNLGAQPLERTTTFREHGRDQNHLPAVMNPGSELSELLRR